MSTIETLAINDATARLSALLSGSANLINKVDALGRVGAESTAHASFQQSWRLTQRIRNVVRRRTIQ